MVAIVPPAAVGTAANSAPVVSCQIVPCEFVTNDRVPVEPTFSGVAVARKSTVGAPHAAGGPGTAAPTPASATVYPLLFVGSVPMSGERKLFAASFASSGE